MVIYENMKVIESAEEMYGDMQCKMMPCKSYHVP